MISNKEEPVKITPHNVAYALVYGALAFPITSLIGWMSGKINLASFGSQFIPMAPSTAISFILLCLSLLLLLRYTLLYHLLMVLVCTIASMIALYSLITFIGLQMELSITPDDLLFSNMGVMNGKPLGRMAPMASVLFFISSISLLAIVLGLLQKTSSTLWHRRATLLGVIVALVGFIFIVSYAFSSSLFYEGSVIPMALPTSLTFLLFGGGLILTTSSMHESFYAWLKIKNLSIETQLRLGMGSILLLVIILVSVAWFSGESIWQETKLLHDYSLQVRRAMNHLTTNVLSMQQDMNDLVNAESEQEKQSFMIDIELLEDKSLRQFDILSSQYLGNKSDIEEIYNLSIQWRSIRSDTIRILNSGKRKEAIERVKGSGIDGGHQKKIITKTRYISDFVIKRADTFYFNALSKKENLAVSLVILFSILSILTWGVSYQLLKILREPLRELLRVTNDFKEGNLDVRSDYISSNEFGLLSASFNTMIDGIQTNSELKEKVTALASLMLSEYDIKTFFQSTLSALAEYTGSQMAAIYLLSADKKNFEHFESIGVDNNARQSFASDCYEGEFGRVLSSRKMQHIKNIPENTRFVFHTVIGKFIPHEILTIPILVDLEIIAVISLATVSTYSDPSIQLIERILVTLCTRIEGIVAFHKIKDFSERLEFQNHKMEAQKTELEAQSIELTRQNTELEIQKQQLSEVSRLKTNFLSNMSHELRTPLNSVIALSGVLGHRLAKKIPDEEYSYLEVIERNGKNLLNLINDILDISRIEAGREEVEVTKFNITNFISDVVTMIYPQAQQKNIELIFTSGNSDLSITSDVDKCRHILQNLIGNAVKFTEEGKVEVSAEQNTEGISIKVSDTGIGISESFISQIFEEFRQADMGTSRKFGGTGLGLAIAKKYATLLGGSITVQSVLGKGSEFTLHLPLNYSKTDTTIEISHNTVSKTSIKAEDPELVIDPKSKTILLVEDSEPAMIQMRDFLEEIGYKILIAHNGSEALGIINNFSPDAIILDLMMPDMDGFEVLKNIRNAEPTAHIPVLILTAKHITKEELTFLKRNDVHQLIQKGVVNRKDLQNAVATLVNSDDKKTPKPKSKIQSIKGKPVVLVVEDNADNMTTIKAILSDGSTILEAVDGLEGIEMAKTHRPNLILMDIQLPKISGIEAFKTIRSNADLQHIPVIALTASAMTSDRETILAHGFDGYIAKPIDAESLIMTIGTILYGK